MPKKRQETPWLPKAVCINMQLVLCSLRPRCFCQVYPECMGSTVTGISSLHCSKSGSDLPLGEAIFASLASY